METSLQMQYMGIFTKARFSNLPPQIALLQSVENNRLHLNSDYSAKQRIKFTDKQIH